MQRIDIDRLRPGDIILTASHTKVGKLVRVASNGLVSHAMICVQHGSIIDSTADGVQAWNLQREYFREDEAVFVFRLIDPLPPVQMARVIRKQKLLDPCLELQRLAVTGNFARAWLLAPMAASGFASCLIKITALPKICVGARS